MRERNRKILKLFGVRLTAGLIVVYVWSSATSIHADGPKFDALLRDGRRVTGLLTSDHANVIQFQTSSIKSISLDDVQSLELPAVPQPLPDRGWKRLTFVTGDVLHGKQILGTSQDGRSSSNLRLGDWFAGTEGPLHLSFADLAQIGHPTGTQCLLYQDFESEASGWLNSVGQIVKTDKQHARSGQYSLKCSSDEPILRNQLLKPLEYGWLEFSFYLDTELSTQDECMAIMQFVAGAEREDLQVTLAGGTRWYEVNSPDDGTWQPQIIPRRPGWHTLCIALQPGRIQLLLDNSILAERRLEPSQSVPLSAVTISGAALSGAIWIDDFAVTQIANVPHCPVLDRQCDQVDLLNGDQLFGKLVAATGQTVSLEVASRLAELNWPEITEVQLALSPQIISAVGGRIVRLEMQSWSNISAQAPPDSLSGALISIDATSCVLIHPMGGRISVPWRKVRRLRPAHLGLEWFVEGRPFHLGDEVKSAFQARIPDGTRLQRTIQVDELAAGPAFVSLTAVDLEPAGPGTLEHPWLKRLRAGELTSELWLNGRRIAILNSAVTGRGSASQPQKIRIKLPAEALQVGANQLEIRLQPSRGALVEYDDWELRDWRVELETTLPSLPSPMKQ